MNEGDSQIQGCMERDPHGKRESDSPLLSAGLPLDNSLHRLRWEFFPLYPLPFFCFSHEICRYGGGSDLSSVDVSHSSRTQLITAFKINKLRPSCSSAEAAASLQVLLRDQIKPQKCISNTPAH